MREIVFDTESTGFEPSEGHRLVEIGCVELINHIPTGETFQAYINPQRDMPAEAKAVHGLSEEFLSDKPLFTEIVDDFLNFIGEDPLVAHNSDFDMRFINAELALAGLPEIPMSRAIDTLKIAREKFPGSPASLDALCRRFEVDSSERTYHGALLDSELLAEVYLELLGGRQHGMALDGENDTATPEDTTDQGDQGTETAAGSGDIRTPRPHAPSETELAAHKNLLGELENNLWDASE